MIRSAILWEDYGHAGPVIGRGFKKSQITPVDLRIEANLELVLWCARVWCMGFQGRPAVSCFATTTHLAFYFSPEDRQSQVFNEWVGMNWKIYRKQMSNICSLNRILVGAALSGHDDSSNIAQPIWSPAAECAFPASCFCISVAALPMTHPTHPKIWDTGIPSTKKNEKMW